MDLIYADKNYDDVGVIQDFSLDLAYGEDENNFELTVPTSANVCKEDYLIYIDGTDYAGIVDAIEVDTEAKTIKYTGRTFQGILEKKIIQPDSGKAYYTVSGDANSIIKTLISRLSLGAFFQGVTDSSVTISSYSFDRYIDGYKGLTRMLNTVGYKLIMSYSNKMVTLQAVPQVTYSDEELTSDSVNFVIKKYYNNVNHMICLGQGDLADRMVRHLYLNASGQVTTTQYYKGIEEITDIYDYANAESEAELIAGGTEKLLESSDSVEVDLGESYAYDIGDYIVATDEVTKITVTKQVIKKIVTIDRQTFKVEYKVGD